MPRRDHLAGHHTLKPMVIRLFGDAGVWIGKTLFLSLQPITQMRAIFYMLAFAPAGARKRGRALSTAHIRAKLWPNHDKSQIASINDCLSQLKREIMEHIERVLDDKADATAYLERVPERHGRQGDQEGQFVLCPRAPLWIDIEAFENLCDRAAQRTDCAKRLKDHEDALKLYGGPILAETRWVASASGRQQALSELYDQTQANYGRTLMRCIENDIEHDRLAAAKTGLDKLDSLARKDAIFSEHAQRLRALLGTHQLVWHIQIPYAPKPPTEVSYALPEPRPPFIGRMEELRQLAELAQHQPLVTLVGPGGAGKTSLALELAYQRPQAWFDVVVMVRLESLSHDAQVPGQLANVLDILDNGGNDPTNHIINALNSKRALIILDNCEHVTAGAAALCRRLLTHYPQVCILVASQRPLGLPEEQLFQVGVLAIPDGNDSPTADAIRHLDSVQLFLHYAKLKRPSLKLTDETAPPIATICQRLEGLALALELAAARLDRLSLRDLAAKLDATLPILERSDQPDSPRHLSMFETITWSYRLLTEREQRLFRRLAVFTGGFSAKAARDICGDDQLQAAEIETLLSELVRASLVVMETRGNQTRYRLLRVLHEYALRLFDAPNLEGEPSADALRHTHALWFAAFAERERPCLIAWNQLATLNALETDHLNLRAAIHWANDRQEREIVLRLASALWRFWWMRSYFTLGREFLRSALAMPGVFPEPEQSLRGLIAGTRCGAAMLAAEQGDYPYAQEQIELSITLRERMSDQAGLAEALGIASRIAYGNNDAALARLHIARGLELWTQLGDACGIADGHKNDGTALYYLGKLDRAREALDHALELYRSCQDHTGISYALINLANVHHRRGEFEKAEALYLESLALRWMLGSRMGIATCLQGMVMNAQDSGQPRRAAWLLGVEEALRAAIGLHIPPQDQQAYDALIASALAALGSDVFDAVKRDGRETQLDHALALLLVAVPTQQPPSQLPSAPNTIEDNTHADFGELRNRLRTGLFPREQAAAELTAEGYTAREIAAIKHCTPSEACGFRTTAARKVHHNLRARMSARMGV